MLIAYLILAVTADPAWIEYGPNGPIARTIVSGDCPEIAVDGAAHRMRTHAEPGPAYPVRTCEWPIPSGAASASIGSTTLPVQKLGRTGRVALVGDTGCRRKAGKTPSIQDCSDPDKWPFARVAESIRAWNPDLIIHVGDYYYREAKCDASGKCAKVPFDWSRWNADFFTPAANLLPSVPWIMIRGNHESCDRAAEGFFRFLDPRDYLWENVQTCKSNTTFTPPYAVALTGAEVLVFDSSGATDGDPDPAQVSAYAAQLGLLGKATRDSWLVLHHPIWAVNPFGPSTPTMWTAWNQAVPTPPISLALAGHIHFLEMLGFANGTPPMAVVGNGGTALDDSPPKTPLGQTIGGRTVTTSYVDDDFGYVAAQRNADGAWVFAVMNQYGRVKEGCVLSGGGMTCATATLP